MASGWVELYRLRLPIAAMIVIVAASNYFVQFPINDWLTWGAFTYPVAYLVTELTNRYVGPSKARKVAWIGFGLAVLLSLWIATPRIALASGTAFLLSQLLDISVFNRLRRQAWWRAPLAAAAIASVIDTVVFFSLAFAGTQLNWLTLAAGDLAAKWFMAVALLLPFRLVLNRYRVPAYA